MNYFIIYLSLIYGYSIKPIISIYEPNWKSLDLRPIPQWFVDAKVGILVNWGIGSSYDIVNEFYWSDWKKVPQGKRWPSEDFMTPYFKKPGFPFQDISREFTAEFYNATEWVTLFKSSGANFVILTVKQLDGYSLWPSMFSYNWNSKSVGPQRDITGELTQAVYSIGGGLRFGIYMSVEEYFNPLFVSDMTNGYKTDAYPTGKLIPQLKELVNTYYPDILFSHCCYNNTPSDYLKIKEFAAWLFNQSPVRDSVVLSDGWGYDFMLKDSVFCTNSEWLNPSPTDCNIWIEHIRLNQRDTHYYVGAATLKDYYTPKQLIMSIVKAIAAGKIALIHILPRKDGTIPLIVEERLLQLGQWKALNGEALYGAEKWNQCSKDQARDIWYTRRGTILYAFFFDWPTDNKIVLNCVTGSENSFSLIGLYDNLEVELQQTFTTVFLANKVEVLSNWAWIIKIKDFQTL